MPGKAPIQGGPAQPPNRQGLYPEPIGGFQGIPPPPINPGVQMTPMHGRITWGGQVKHTPPYTPTQRGLMPDPHTLPGIMNGR